MTVVVDSDILVEVFRARNADVLAKWTELSGSDAVVLYTPVSVAEQAGAYLRKYRLSHGVGIADALIAACAVANKAELWTRNRKHYPIPDLSFFD